jgi:hypothetical protein
MSKFNIRRQVLESMSSSEVDRVSMLRRKFLRGMGVIGAAAAVGSVMGSSKAARAQISPSYATAITDDDILNFALNLEYVEAEFYLHAAYNGTLPSAYIGTNPGAVSGGAAVPFRTALIRDMAETFATDEQNHVGVLRAALGTAAVPRPALNIGTAFQDAAIAAGIITSGQTFDVYANEDNFLLGSFIFEDVGVTAYNGAAPFIQDKTYLAAAASILGVEAYHAGAIRAELGNLGTSNASLISDANKISALRASADGSSDNGHETPLQDSNGIIRTTAEDPTTSLAYARTFAEVLRIVYLGARASAHGGGFFPNGLNGTIH